MVYLQARKVFIMDIPVDFYDHDIVVTVDGQFQIILTIGELKDYFHQRLGIPVAEQLLYEQGGQDDLGDNICIQNLEDIENRGLWLELRNPGDYKVDLVVMLPGGIRLNCRVYCVDQVLKVKNICSSIIPADADNITLQVDGTELGDNELLSQFVNGAVITCTVKQSIPV